MCMSCGCWMDPSKGGDGAHQENPTVMPNIKIERSPLDGKSK